MLIEELLGFPAAEKAYKVLDRQVLGPLDGVSNQLVVD